MKVIKLLTVRQWAQKYTTAAPSLEHWLTLIRAADFKDFMALKQAFRTADLVRVASGRKVIVFNISGNNHRFIAAVHFNRQCVFALRFMPHAEYSKDFWKATL